MANAGSLLPSSACVPRFSAASCWIWEHHAPSCPLYLCPSRRCESRYSLSPSKTPKVAAADGAKLNFEKGRNPPSCNQARKQTLRFALVQRDQLCQSKHFLFPCFYNNYTLQDISAGSPLLD